MRLPRGERTVRTLTLAAAAGLICSTALVFQPAPSYGMGEEKKCPDGQIWSDTAEKCIKKEASIDDRLYEQGRRLAKAGHYESAIRVLRSVPNQNEPRVLNYLGYSHRKMGRISEGLAYYEKALAIDPDFVLAREYMGEGYVAIGKMELAKLQLSEIEKRCGTDCSSYQKLAAVIAGQKHTAW